MREGTEREETSRGSWGSERERRWCEREEEHTGKKEVNKRARMKKVRSNGGQTR